MGLKLPASVFNVYNDVVKNILEKKCTIIYPEVREECPNCILSTLSSGMSISIYKENGPQPFEDGMPCPYCNGSGYKAIETTEIIPMRLYWDKKKWYKVSDINIENCSLQTISNMLYLPKLQRCKYLIPANNTIEKHIGTKYQKSTQPIPIGFEQNSDKYCIIMWEILQ